MDATKLLDKAQVAAERGNYDYAIDLYLQLLEFQPDNTDSRRKLREVEVRKFQELGITSSSPASWIKGLGSLVAALVFLLVRKYDKCMTACEMFLKKDPYNSYVLRILAKAAERAELLETAILVNNNVVSHDGAAQGFLGRRLHVRTLRDLGDLYLQTEQLPKAAETYEQILRLVPRDREAEHMLRDIAARRSMVEGGWDKAGQRGGYRKVLKDESKAKSLEDSQRDIRTREDIEGAIERTKNDLAEDPKNTRLIIQVGDYYRMLKDWDSARGYYQKAQEIDPTNFLVTERLGDLKLAQMDEQIRTLEEQGDEERLKEVRQQRSDAALKEFQRRVKARPQDLPTRYTFGNILYQRGQYKEAAVQYQHASRDPKTRRGALYRLGLCFRHQGLIDLAVEQFEKAVSGASLVDEQSKQVLYSLGEARESQGRLAEALDAYKKIFELDINFRDVSQKIESLYQQGAKDAG
ncbi:MAG: tetratricopeptide repeat protein [Candidatus Brocadiia bacterium]